MPEYWKVLSLNLPTMTSFSNYLVYDCRPPLSAANHAMPFLLHEWIVDGEANFREASSGDPHCINRSISVLVHSPYSASCRPFLLQ